MRSVFACLIGPPFISLRFDSLREHNDTKAER